MVKGREVPSVELNKLLEVSLGRSVGPVLSRQPDGTLQAWGVG